MVRYRVLQLLLLVSVITSQVIGMMSSEKSSTVPQIEKTTAEEVNSNMPFQLQEIGEGIAQKIEELPKELGYNIFSLALELRENPKYEVYKKLDVGSYVKSIALNGDNTRVLTGSDDGVARLWGVKEGNLLQELKGHTAAIRLVALSADGSIAFTGSNDGTARIWDMNTGELIKTIQLSFSVYSMALSADGALALTGGLDGIGHLYNTSTGELLKELKGHTKAISSVALSADGTLALTGSWDGRVRVFNTLTEELIKTLQVGSPVSSVALSADGNSAVIACMNKAQVWDIKAGVLLNTLLTDDSVCSVAVSKDGKRAFTGTFLNIIQVWNAKPLPGQKETSTPLTVLKDHTGSVYSIALGDNDLIASGSYDNTVLIWKPFALKPQEPRENQEVLWQPYKEIFSKPKFLYPDKK